MAFRRFAAAALVAVAVGACGGSKGPSGSASGPPTTDVVDQSPSAAAGDRAVEFPGAGKVQIDGTLSIPAAATKSGTATVPAVLFVPDLGAGDRNGPISLTNVPDPLAQDLGTAFTKAGLATLRYDRRGTGESKLDPGTALSFDDTVADAKAGLDLLAQRKETAGQKLTVVGYGEGALTAIRLAATDNRVSKLVLVSPPGRPLVEVHAAQLAAIYGPDSGDALRTTVASMLATGALPPLESLRSELRPLLPAAEIAYLTSQYTFDPVAELAKVTVPVLVATGSKATAPGPADAAALAAANPKVQSVVADGADGALDAVLPPPAIDPSDPNSPYHEHGAAAPSTTGPRDAATIGLITTFVQSPST